MLYFLRVFKGVVGSIQESSMPSYLDPLNSIEVPRGATRTIEISIIDDCNDNKPFDLTGSTVYLTVKKSVENRVPLIQKTSGDITQIEFTDTKGGIVKVYFIPNDTKLLDIGRYVFDVWVVTLTGRYPVIEPSVFSLTRGVTELV